MRLMGISPVKSNVNIVVKVILNLVDVADYTMLASKPLEVTGIYRSCNVISATITVRIYFGKTSYSYR